MLTGVLVALLSAVSEQDLMDAGDRLASYVARLSTRSKVVALESVDTRVAG